MALQLLHTHLNISGHVKQMGVPAVELVCHALARCT